MKTKERWGKGHPTPRNKLPNMLPEPSRVKKRQIQGRQSERAQHSELEKTEEECKGEARCHKAAR